MSRVDVFDVTVLKVIGGVSGVEALGGGRGAASLVLNVDGVLEAVGSEDVLLVAGAGVALRWWGEREAPMCRARRCC